MKIVVLGPGLMGSQIGCEYAFGGNEVVFLARRPDVAHERIARSLATALEHGLATPGQTAAGHERMTIATDVDSAEGAQIVVESVVEDLAEKATALTPVIARAPASDRRHQYVLYPDHGDRRRRSARRSGPWAPTTGTRRC